MYKLFLTGMILVREFFQYFSCSLFKVQIKIIPEGIQKHLKFTDQRDTSSQQEFYQILQFIFETVSPNGKKKKDPNKIFKNKNLLVIFF